MRERVHKPGLSYPPRPHTMNSEQAFDRISQSRLFYDPPGVFSYAKCAASRAPWGWLKVPPEHLASKLPEIEEALLNEGFQYIYAYTGNPKMVVRPYMCELAEGEQFTARFTFVTSGFDMVGFDSPRDAILFRMGDVHEEFLSNVPA